jgi:hypothetical protein
LITVLKAADREAFLAYDEANATGALTHPLKRRGRWLKPELVEPPSTCGSAVCCGTARLKLIEPSSVG